MTGLRALLIINRCSRRGAACAEAAAARFAARGAEFIEAGLQRPADMDAAIARHAAAVDVIVVGGGDGTLNLAAGPIRATGKPMAVLPLGTANDFARTLGIPTTLAAACDNALDGIDHAIDLGQCNDVYFLNVASLGLAVRACEYRSDRAKQWFGALGYAANVCAAVRDTRPFTAEVSFAGGSTQLRSIQIAVGNGRYFGGGLAVSSDARLDDGRLDLYSLEPQSLIALARRLPGLIRGPRASMRGIALYQGKRFHIHTEQPMDINTDGEILTRTPATLRVLPRALTVRVPPAYLDRPGSGGKPCETASTT